MDAKESDIRAIKKLIEDSKEIGKCLNVDRYRKMEEEYKLKMKV